MVSLCFFGDPSIGQLWTGLGLAEWFAHCAGCRNGGGPPGLRHQALRSGDGLRAVQLLRRSGGCTRLDWLRQHGQEVRDLLKESRGCRRRVYLEDEIFLLIRTIL